MGGNGGGCDREQTINSTKMYSQWSIHDSKLSKFSLGTKEDIGEDRMDQNSVSQLQQRELTIESPASTKADHIKETEELRDTIKEYQEQISVSSEIIK